MSSIAEGLAHLAPANAWLLDYWRAQAQQVGLHLSESSQYGAAYQAATLWIQTFEARFDGRRMHFAGS